ncbi:flavodoxin family protein [Allohahella marinimesophila]|uniref:NAD(P)H-dependent oxidoreductase n=1 Tax=Allohahella marinimesophila TaxID=1054972 RepID=A0ABP7NP90_9GAMM
MSTVQRTLLIISHAPSRNTQALQQSLLEGAGDEGIEAVAANVRSPFDTKPEHVRAADALILFTPENLGYMSGALKDFFDRIYYPCLEDTQGKPYALIVRAGHDGTGTCRAVSSIATGLRWREIRPPTVCKGDYQPAFAEWARELGLLVAASLDNGLI